MKPIAYEPHPVSYERKAELIAQGFKIVDARFMPAQQEVAETPETLEPEAFKPRGRPRKVTGDDR